MTKDIIVTIVAYLVTVVSFLVWIFIRKPEHIPLTKATAFAICLRSVPLFLVLFLVCRSFNITVVFGLALLAAIGFLTLGAFGYGGLPGLALFYVVQQWILGWPDRALLVNAVSLESNQTTGGPDPLIGHSARTTTPLRPMGKVAVNGKELDALCEFGFLEQDQEVEIVGKRGYTLIVTPKDGET